MRGEQLVRRPYAPSPIWSAKGRIGPIKPIMEMTLTVPTFAVEANDIFSATCPLIHILRHLLPQLRPLGQAPTES